MTFEENDRIDLIAPQIKTLIKQIMEKIASKNKNKTEGIKMMLGLKSLLSQIAEKNNELNHEVNEPDKNNDIEKEEIKNESLYNEYSED